MSKQYQPQRLQRSRRPSKTCHTFKRRLRADGLLLLPSALRPCLRRRAKVAALGAVAIVASGVAAVQSTDVFAESITLTIPSEPLTLDITPTADGAFSESEDAKFSVTTDALAGYTLTIKSQGDNNVLTNGVGGEIPSIATTQTDVSRFDKNNWGYKPSKLGGTTNDKYQPGPTSSQIIEKTNKANGNAADSYTIKLGVKVDTTIPYGTYSNTFVLTATVNATTYSIKYDTRGGTGGPGTQTVESYDATPSVVISETKPTRSKDVFKGWCSTETNDLTCPEPGVSYQPGESYSFAEGTTTVTLYAMWEQAYEEQDLGELGNMQDFRCSKLSVQGNYGTVTDTRDQNTYRVAKLKDNRCWMIENLRLGSSSETMTLTSSNTDISSTYTLPVSSPNGFYDNTAANVYVDASNTSYGGYYSWIAATAGTGNSTELGKDATDSICPKGWRLPTKDEYDILVTAYGGDSSIGSSNLRVAPVPGFVYAGYYWGSSPRNQDSFGDYWSSTASDDSPNFAYYLRFYSSNAYTNDWYREPGYPVRCIARQ